ncbi:5-deoxy-glucuronate isomerase [Woeseia oceani]|uniref:5-deoxy-glucuronate isomerase n=1 Tax=Woeseia oceani TaxID=1548547 RepID=A0A193LD90_9GAMM|nr:5-deoxy-glucuronate isomerase [Woeseia oceani]ANO50495.1 5-deoxy-glucuronate isomerase [Woeseia oceani]
MSRLLSRPHAPDEQGLIQKITPQSAGWQYVGFEVYQLQAGQALEQDSSSDEVCLVIVTGKADIATNEQAWTNLGERESLFERKPPFSVYVPPNDHFRVVATTDMELAVCKAPATGEYPARLIKPEDCRYEVRGEGTNQRIVCNILFDNFAAEKLLVCEVITPGGNWSSYPPHKHDRAIEHEETQLEEIYFHRVNPPQGFAVQRVYTDDRSLDETMTVENHSVVMVPEGYHPVGAPHGYDLYYLNVMAGPERNWVFNNDPQHEWIVKT